jgi:hypothetical protein
MRRIIRVETTSKQHKHEYEIHQTNKNKLIVDYKANGLLGHEIYNKHANT